MNTHNSLDVLNESIPHNTIHTIENFLIKYAYTLDDGLVKEWESFFCDDGLYFVTTFQNEEDKLPIGIIHCQGRGMMSDRITALETANIYEAHRYCHNVTKPQIEFIDSHVFKVRSNFSIYRTMENGHTDLYATGKYLDLIVFSNETPKFKERRVILDSKRVDTLMVVPI
jgi:3-phenylpropionate/cinnamic acid dioxygenase small subunit